MLRLLAVAAAIAVTITTASWGLGGPDLVVCRVGGTMDNSGFSNWGAVGGIRAYSAESVICNYGDMQCGWDAALPEPDNNHPVLSQTMYRLRNGRLIQIGQSWVKHGVNAANQIECQLPCQTSGTSSALGIGCCDAYSTGTNGTQNVGPKSEINPSTATYPYPFCSPGDGGMNCPPADATIGRRLQVKDTEIDTSTGVQYFLQMHVITPDEINVASPHTDLNNTSYRALIIGANKNINSWSGDTFTEPAIKAWKRNGLGPGVTDPKVDEFAVAIVGDGEFYFAAKASDNGDGTWHYEYAVQNINSDRAGQSFTVPLPPGITLTNVLFHDVDYHSGEPYSNTDWTNVVGPASTTWATETFAANPNANALRWDTLYNFRFDANRPPKTGTVTLGLFKPGTPTSIIATLPVPDADCNGNSIGDATDIANGTSQDINHDGVPDECQSVCAGDINGDHTVNVNDLLGVVTSWGPCPAPCPPSLPNCPADIVSNCAIDVNDLLAVVSHWGPCGPVGE